MEGRSSIKNALSTLVSELSYADVAIHEGGTASSTVMH